MSRRALTLLATALVAACAGPAGAPAPQAVEARTGDVLRASFRAQGIAGIDRLDQDALQRACSQEAPPAREVAQRLEAEAAAAIVYPSDGRFLGDWREGEKLAQSGRGATWSDAPGAPNGGNCYNCHQIARTEIAYGTIGPSLERYGQLRGDGPEVLRYTWGKLWNAKATNACSAMPRFGAHGLLTVEQMRHLMALLLDPASPVNR